MVWIVVVKNRETGRLELVTPSSEFDPEDPRYDPEINVVPFKVEPDPKRLDFGFHELAYNCVCHPKISSSTSGQTIISHRAAVN
jgi:hypothetical protein